MVISQGRENKNAGTLGNRKNRVDGFHHIAPHLLQPPPTNALDIFIGSRPYMYNPNSNRTPIDVNREVESFFGGSQMQNLLSPSICGRDLCLSSLLKAWGRSRPRP